MPRKGAKKSFLLTPIGVLRTPFKGLKECPFQGPKDFVLVAPRGSTLAATKRSLSEP
jgi:hypothetical protein